MKKQTPLLLLLVPILVAGLTACPPATTVEFSAVLPESGDAAVYGDSIKKGMELAIEQLVADNSSGFEVSFQFYDSASDPAQAASLLETAFSSSTAAIGGVTSDEALAMIDTVNRAEKVLLSPSASSPELSGASRYFFRIFPSSVAEASTMTTFVAEKLEIEELAILASDDAFGTGTAKAFEEAFRGDLLGSIIFSSNGTDIAEAAAEAVSLQPEANNEQRARTIYVAATGSDLVQALQALRGGGFDRGRDYILTSSALASPDVLAAAGSAANRAFLTMVAFDSTSEKEPVKSFVENYRAKYATDPDLYSAHGYDSVAVLLKALEEAGESAAFGSEFVKGMRAIQGFPGVAGTVQFRETGDAQKFVRVFFVAGGEPTDYEEYIQKIRDDFRKKQEELKREIERLSRQSG